MAQCGVAAYPVAIDQCRGLASEPDCGAVATSGPWRQGRDPDLGEFAELPAKPYPRHDSRRRIQRSARGMLRADFLKLLEAGASDGGGQETLALSARYHPLGWALRIGILMHSGTPRQVFDFLTEISVPILAGLMAWVAFSKSARAREYVDFLLIKTPIFGGSDANDFERLLFSIVQPSLPIRGSRRNPDASHCERHRPKLHRAPVKGEAMGSHLHSWFRCPPLFLEIHSSALRTAYIGNDTF